MNKENAHMFIPLIQALADGKSIQINNMGGWRDLLDPSFHFSVDRYRIKPEPPKLRDCWVNFYKSGGSNRFENKHLADIYGVGRSECVHFREVLPEP